MPREERFKYLIKLNKWILDKLEESGYMTREKRGRHNIMKIITGGLYEEPCSHKWKVRLKSLSISSCKGLMQKRKFTSLAIYVLNCVNIPRKQDRSEDQKEAVPPQSSMSTRHVLSSF